MRRQFLMVLRILCPLALLAVVPRLILAQSVQNGSITGTVTDSSGAAVPNVKVTATSPALQVPFVTAQTDSDGTYKIVNLPAPGEYRVQFEAQGFQTFVRSGIVITVGFNALIDAKMAVGSLATTVEVSGQSPVVDTATTAAATTLVQQQIEDLPHASDLQDWLTLLPGVKLAGAPDVGDSNIVGRSSAITYGVPLQTTLGVEGLNTTTDHGADTAIYLDSFAFQETEFKTVGNNADVAYPGLAQVAVLKSGSNDLHGEFRGAYENPSFQANNITPAEAAPPNNLKFTNPITSPGYYEFAADIGGHVVRNKLWYYAGYSELALSQEKVGLHSGPDDTISTSPYGLQYACWTCGDAPAANNENKLVQYNMKGSWQVTPGLKLLGVYMIGEKLEPDTGSSTSPFPNSKNEHQPLWLWNGEVQDTLSSRLLFDALLGFTGYRTYYYPQPGVNVAGDPSEKESSNSLTTGANSEYYVHLENRWELPASLTFIPTGRYLGGTHQLKFGTDLNWEGAGDPVPVEYAPGDYQLIFNNGVPFEVSIFNYPNHPIDQLHSQAYYVTDNWALKHVTLNLGVRGERYTAFYPNQTVAAKQFAAEFPPTTVPGKTVATWSDVVPRVGGAWDVRGDGKTVVKASFGMFGDTMGDSIASHFNPGATQSKTYTWDGPCAPTAPNAPVEYQCDATSAYFASLPSAPACTTGYTGTCLQGTGGVLGQIIYPTKQDRTYEYAFQVERQVAQNTSINFDFVRYSIHNNLDAATNEGSVGAGTTYSGNSAGSEGIVVGVPYDAYTIPVQFTDAATGNPITVYTYNPANCLSFPTSSLGTGSPECTASEILNSPSYRPDIYDTFEGALTRRYYKKLSTTVSFYGTKDHRWIDPLVGIAGSPNDGNFPIDNTWNWEAMANAIYDLPMGFQVSGSYRATSGAYGQRTEKFTSKSLQQGTVTMAMGPIGQYEGPVVPLLNVRVSKTFKLGEKMRLQGNLDVFNLLNSSAATSTNYLTTTNVNAPTFGVITGILSPRVARIGAIFSF